jgi:hypothetical protein
MFAQIIAVTANVANTIASKFSISHEYNYSYEIVKFKFK